MKIQKLQISGSCEFTLTTFEGIEHKSVCLEYTEHSPDHWHSDAETSIDIDADKAREIVAFMHKAFPEIAPPAQQQEPVAVDVTIDDEGALAVLRDMVVQSNGDLTGIRLLVGHGHWGYGLYVANAEYQEEGALLLTHTSPPASKPMTDEQCDEAIRRSGLWTLACTIPQNLAMLRGLCREAAHGIK